MRRLPTSSKSTHESTPADPCSHACPARSGTRSKPQKPRPELTAFSSPIRTIDRGQFRPAVNAEIRHSPLRRLRPTRFDSLASARTPATPLSTSFATAFFLLISASILVPGSPHHPVRPPSIITPSLSPAPTTSSLHPTTQQTSQFSSPATYAKLLTLSLSFHPSSATLSTSTTATNFLYPHNSDHRSRIGPPKKPEFRL